MDQAEAEAAARDNYDRMADEYWAHVEHELSIPSLFRGGFELFAHRTQAGAGGRVVDVGCGPGHVTAWLAEHGLDISGVDISPGLLEIARTTYPSIRFETGQLADLPIETDSLRGVLSRHSLIHTPPELVPAAFSEFARILEPGGWLCLSFFAAERSDTHGDPFDHAVTTAWRFDIGWAAELLAETGFAETDRLIRQPRQDERQLPNAMFLARLSR